jgi:hypothetical protein
MNNLKSLTFVICTFLVTFLAPVAILSSCGSKSGKRKCVTKPRIINKEPITISYIDTSEEGRALYRVYMSDSIVAEYLYAEEIANALVTGHWRYDETLEIK